MSSTKRSRHSGKRDFQLQVTGNLLNAKANHSADSKYSGQRYVAIISNQNNISTNLTDSRSERTKVQLNNIKRQRCKTKILEDIFKPVMAYPKRCLQDQFTTKGGKQATSSL